MLLGMLLGIGASVSWAIANVAVQRASLAVGPYRALLWAQAVGVAAIGASGLLAYATMSRIDPWFPPPSTGVAAWIAVAGVAAWIAVAGVAALLGYFCLFYAFAHGRLTLAVPIMSSWAVLSAGLSLLLFHDHLAVGQLAGAGAVIAGAIVVARHAQNESAAATGRGAGTPTPRWLVASIGAAVGFGVLIPSMGRLTPVFGTVGAIGVVYLADAALGLPLALSFRIGLAPPRGRAWLSVILAGFFETSGFVCIIGGARLAPLTVVAPLASLAAALTVLYAWAILGERPARGVLVGAGLVCVGVVVLAL